MPAPLRPDVERRRFWLNVLVLFVPVQFFVVIIVYWTRFLPALRPVDFDVPAPSLAVVTATGLLPFLPALLPRGYFRPRAFERGRLYPALGLRLFRAVTTDGDWINARLRRLDPGYRVVRDRRTRAEHIAGTVTNERWHSAWLLLGLATQASAMATGQYRWAIAIAAFNLVFNLYPILHQRYKRARLRADGGLFTSPRPAAPSAPPASSPDSPRIPS